MEKESHVIFVGRLAEYRYYNMDAMIRGLWICLKKESWKPEENVAMDKLYCNSGL